MNIERTIGGYRELRLPTPRHIDAVWVHCTPFDLEFTSGSQHRLLPDSCVNVCFSRFRNGSLSNGWLSFFGPIVTPGSMPLVAGHEMSSVRLHPEWALPLLGIHPREHTDGICNLADVAPNIAEGLLDRLEQTADATVAARVLFEWAAGLVGNTASIDDNPAQGAAHMIRLAGGRTRVSEISKRLEMSDRHLRRLVEGVTGFAPKQYARLLRFNAAVALADAEPAPSWAGLAAEAGYFDQAHMIRDFSALADRTPAALHAERTAESDLYNPVL